MLQFILTCNLSIMVSVFLTVCIYGETPLSFFQLLWVFMALNTLGALALAVEPPAGNELESPPESKTGSLMTRVMWRNTVGQVIYQTIVILLLLTIGGSIFDIDYAETDPFYPSAEQVAAHHGTA